MVPLRPTMTIRGVQVFQGMLDRATQEALLQQIRDVVAAAPLFSPMTPYGKPMSVQMTSAGSFGWGSDERGYRYSPNHPNGQPWPDIPPIAMDVWDQVSGSNRAPDSCLVNLHRDSAKMGLHQDRHEADMGHPEVSISLGDDGMFRLGKTTRGRSTEAIWLKSGDDAVMGGDPRLA